MCSIPRSSVLAYLAILGQEALDVVGPFSKWFRGKTLLLPEAGPLPSSIPPLQHPRPQGTNGKGVNFLLPHSTFVKMKACKPGGAIWTLGGTGCS